MNPKLEEVKELYKDTLAFAVHQSLQEITTTTDGKTLTQEQQVAEALIAKAKSGNTTAANMIIKLNKSYQQEEEHLRGSEEYLRAKYNGALPVEMIDALDACNRNITLAELDLYFSGYVTRVNKYIKAVQSGAKAKELNTIKKEIEEQQKKISKFFDRELHANLEVPFYNKAEEIIKKESVIESKDGSVEKKGTIASMRWEVYEYFMERHGIIIEEDEEESLQDKQDVSKKIISQESIPQNKKGLSTDIKSANKTSEQTEVTKEDINIKGLPVLTELSSLQDICKVLHRITKIEDFKIVPTNSQDVMLLLNKLKGENGNKIYRSLPNNVTHIFKKAIEYLHDHFDLLQEKECEQQTKEGLEDIVRLKRV